MSVQNSKNVAALQILRAIAAILIVIWHSHLAIKYASANYWIEGNAQYRAAHYPSVLNHLDIGVDIFFCISGFIMALLIYKAAPSATASLTFLIRRALRILPPYWFFSCLVVVAFVMSAGKFNAARWLTRRFDPTRPRVGHSSFRRTVLKYRTKSARDGACLFCSCR